MKRVGTSLVLASANVIVVGLEYVADRTHLVPKQLPYSIVLWLGVTLPAVVPFLLFATAGFAIWDLFRPRTRWQAMIAVVLSILIGVIYFRPE